MKHILLLLTFVTYFTPICAQVSVKINESEFMYEQPVRIAEVLAPVALKKNWYWQSAQLFDVTPSAVNAIEKQRDILTENLNKRLYSKIAQQLESWAVADRIHLHIDYDLARLSALHNPQLQFGEYQIIMRERPTSMYVFGAVQTSEYIAYQENKCVGEIMDGIVASAEADKSHVYMIYPNGSVYKAPIAYWNAQCIQAIPGSMLYIPLRESQWTDENQKLNKQIVALATNRIDL